MNDSEIQKPVKTHEDILAQAKDRFRLASEADSEIRIAALDDYRFRAGDQWDPKIKADRNRERRPCLTINRLPQFVSQVTNDQRQNRPSIKVSPIDDKADIDTAKIYQGLIRHIEYSSGADVAYDTAFEQAVIGGRGFYRIVTDYCDPYSFDQEIKVQQIPSEFNVYFDPASNEPDGSDANWCFVFQDMTHDDYRAQFKGSELSNMSDWRSIGDNEPLWFGQDSVRVAEYYYKTFKEIKICQLNTGEIVVKSPGETKEYPPGVEVIRERTSILPAIKWVKMNGIEILDETDWPGQWIPVIPVYGHKLIIDGIKQYEGIVRHAKDPQRMYNYWASAETETMALAPKAPFIAAEGQIEDHEAQWETANTENHSVLKYNPISIAGIAVPPPQRQVFEPPVQAINQARMQSSEDLKATTGIYDASLGARSNENSGIAIQRRNQQAQTSNFHFTDNLTRSIRHGGRIMIDLIPHIYDTPRTARILGEEGEEEIVRINEEFEKGGERKIYQLGVGKYDVAVETGPSYATKRQEAAASMVEFTKALPNQAAVISDLMVKNMDWPGAQEIAERLRKTLPPGIAEPKGGEQKPIPPEVQMQMQQMQQMVEALTEELKVKTQQIETKTLELESKERIENAKIQANIEIEMAKLGSTEAIELLRQEVAQIESRLQMLGVNQPIGNNPSAGGNPALQSEMNQQQPIGGSSPSTTMGV